MFFLIIVIENEKSEESAPFVANYSFAEML